MSASTAATGRPIATSPAATKRRLTVVPPSLWPHCFNHTAHSPHMLLGYYLWSDQLWRWTCAMCEGGATQCWRCGLTGVRFEQGQPRCVHCRWLMRWADVVVQKGEAR